MLPTRVQPPLVPTAIEPQYLPTLEEPQASLGTAPTLVPARRSGRRPWLKKIAIGLGIFLVFLIILANLKKEGPTPAPLLPPLTWPPPPLGLEALNLVPRDNTVYFVLNPAKIPEKFRPRILKLLDNQNKSDFFEFTARTGLSFQDLDHLAGAFWLDVEQVHLDQLAKKPAMPKGFPTQVLRAREPWNKDRKERILWALRAERKENRLFPNRLAYHPIGSLNKKGEAAAFVVFPSDQTVVVTTLPSERLPSLPGLQDPPADFSPGIMALLNRAQKACAMAFVSLEGENQRLSRGIVLDPKVFKNPKMIYDALFHAQAFAAWLTWNQEAIEFTLGLQCGRKQDPPVLVKELTPVLKFIQFLGLWAPQEVRPVVMELLKNARFATQERTLLFSTKLSSQVWENVLKVSGH